MSSKKPTASSRFAKPADRHSRLALEPLESRTLLSASYGGYASAMEFLPTLNLGPQHEIHYESYQTVSLYEPVQEPASSEPHFYVYRETWYVYRTTSAEAWGQPTYASGYDIENPPPTGAGSISNDSHRALGLMADQQSPTNHLPTEALGLSTRHQSPPSSDYASARAYVTNNISGGASSMLSLSGAQQLLDATAVRPSGLSSRASLRPSTPDFDHAFASYSATRFDGSAHASASAKLAPADESMGRTSDSGEGGFAKLADRESLADDAKAGASRDLRRSAIDAALTQLTRMRQRYDRQRDRLAATESKSQEHPKAEPSGAQAEATVAPDDVAGMVLIQVDGSHVSSFVGDDSAKRPAIEAMVGVFRALDFGTESETPVAPVVEPLSDTPIPSTGRRNTAVSKEEAPPDDRRSNSIGGAALAAGALTLAVGHDLYQRRRRQP
jgi:hypothetical protein